MKATQNGNIIFASRARAFLSLSFSVSTFQWIESSIVKTGVEWWSYKVYGKNLDCTIVRWIKVNGRALIVSKSAFNVFNSLSLAVLEKYLCIYIEWQDPSNWCEVMPLIVMCKHLNAILDCVWRVTINPNFVLFYLFFCSSQSRKSSTQCCGLVASVRTLPISKHLKRR